MQAGAVIAERFRIEQSIGAGGMGTIYRARDLVRDQPVAVKLHTSAEDASPARFGREAAVLATLQHPAIVRYIAHGVTAAGKPYLVMEWLAGEDLAQRLRRQRLPASEAVQLLITVAEALEVAHRAGIVHRDIKPANLFLVDGQAAKVKLLDFGVARLRSFATVTGSGMVIGTPDYMAPEQVRGQSAVDHRADLFALGCVLYECLVGRTPFASEHPMGAFARILFEPAPRLRSRRPELPPALDELLDAMLAKDPAQRPGSAAEVASRLALIRPQIGALAEAGGEALTPPTPPAALTRHELRLLCLGVVRPYGREHARATTHPGPQQAALLARLQQGVAPFAGRLVPLPDGSILILLESTASAAEQAEMAAYCALEVRALLPGVPIALCLGHSEQAADRLDAEVVERAAAMLAHCPRAALAEGAASPATAPILIDESLRALLTSHFACSRVAGLNVLHDKRAAQNLSSPERLAPFAGRERELAQLHIVLGNCLDESRADAVLILGEAGMGKSRLCHEFLAQVRAQHPELTIWIGRADPSSAGSPFGLIAQTLRRAAGIADDDSPPLQRAKLRERLGLLPPDDRARVYEFIGELLGLPGDDRESPPLAAARRDPLLMGDQLRRAFCDLLAAECRAQPLLLVLEDLQWGDLPTVHLIDAALRELPELPLLVLALSRPQIHEQFPRLWEGRSVQQMPLGQLGQKAGERIVRGLLGDDVTPAQVQALVERGAGNAFFLEELARAAAEGHLDQVPESVLAIVQARIMRLDAPARSVLRAASVYGQAFWPGGVACLLGLPAGPDGAATVSGLLAQLVARDLISQRRESRFRKEPEYCFRHALVRQAAYAMLTESDRRLGHRLAADFLLRAGEQDALVLADHLDLGGEADRAVTHYRRVVRDAVEGNDFAAALAYAERAIAGGAQGEALGELLALQAEARLWRSEFEQAQERALAALACLPTRHPAYYRAIESLAITAGRRLDNQQLASLTDRLLELAEAGERSDAYVVAAVRLGAQTYIAGQYELARRLLSRIEELTSADAAERPPAIQAQIYVMRGNRAAYEWRIDTCAELYERSAELFDRAGDLRSGASQRLDAAMTCFDFGAFGRSVRLLQQTIAIAERLGLVRLLAMSRHGLASTLWRLERLDEALALAERARHELSRQGDARGVGTCLINLARIHLSRGALDAAEGCAEQARQVLAGTPRFQARALVQLARVQLGYGRNDQALALAQQAMEALSRLGRLGADEAALRLCHAQALLAVGDTAAASAAAQLGRERLQMQAAFIATESARQSFLTGLAENVQLLDLAAQLAPPAAAPGL